MGRPQLEVFAVDEPTAADVMVVEVARWHEDRAAIRAEGYAAGYAAAEILAEKKSNQAQAEIYQILDRLDAEHAALEAHFSAMNAQIFLAICQKILPAMGRETLGAHLCETLNHVLREPFDQPITLEINPVSVPTVSRWMAHSKVIAWSLRENADLALAAARLHLPDSSLHLDLSRTAEDITRQLHDYFTQKLESRHD